MNELPRTIEIVRVTNHNFPTPGQVYRTDYDPPDQWGVCCPKCGKISLASKHTVKVEDDGTLTFDPSLVCPRAACGAHYWIRRNQIEYC